MEVLEILKRYSVNWVTGEVLYSVCFGSYDEPKSPKIADSIPCFFFTDRRPKTIDPRWIIVLVDTSQQDGHRLQRYFKILAHLLFPNASRAIYCDAACRFLADISPIHEAYKNIEFLALKHHSRDCVYAEADACIAAGKDDPYVIKEQMSRYRAADFPNEAGLYATPLRYRCRR